MANTLEKNTPLANYDGPGMLMPIVSPSQAVEAHKAAVAFINDVLDKGVDIGVIPGTGGGDKDKEKLNLLKPGAEKLAGTYALRPVYEVLEQEIDHDRAIYYSLPKWVKANKPSNWEDVKKDGLGRNKKNFRGQWEWQEKEVEEGTSYGLYRYVLCCKLFRGDVEVGQGVGSCSSMEAKYIRTPRDVENTVLKMAKKRAFVDSILTTLGLSDRFTQDIEDITANKSVYEDEGAPGDEGDIASQERPTVGIPVQQQHEMLQWLVDHGVRTKTLKKELEDAIAARDGNFFTIVAEMIAAGAKDLPDMLHYIEDGTLLSDVVDAEFKEDEEPPKDETAPSVADSATSVPAVAAVIQVISQIATAKAPTEATTEAFELMQTEAAKLSKLCKDAIKDKTWEQVKDAAWAQGGRTTDELEKYIVFGNILGNIFANE